MPQRSYKFRFYPTAAQENQLPAYFGHGRFVWNQMLKLRSGAWNRWGISLNFADTSAQLTCLKQTKPWLHDVPATLLVQKLQDLDRAFQNFFQGRARHPRIKRRSDGHQSVRLQLDQRLVGRNYVPGEMLILPGLGPVDLVWSRIPAGAPKMVTLSRDPAGRYFVSFAVEEAIHPLPATGRSAGIDLGVKDLLVASDGEREPHPKALLKRLRRLKRAQRRLSRCVKGSRRRQRATQRVAKLHARVADARRDALHQITTRLVRRYDAIALEDLHVKGMVRNHRLARTLSDAGLGELRRQIQYKAEWYGRTIVTADRWYPSSKLCSACGHRLDQLPLSIRSWTCPSCGAAHDRDLNAAMNLLHLLGEAHLPGGAGKVTAVERDTPVRSAA